ncbi:peptide methionine sulfoxide reductase, partial [Nannochloropsis gaditana CCMP526]|uniref:peptide methionine sulfoxide reductase n=1 Tax=Nannochloropsis gaditana (strain CCMP526) TaxID=1093141 RepID=UPI00029F591D
YSFAFFRNGPFVPSTPRSFSLATRLSIAKATPGDVATIDLSIMLEDGTAMPADFDTGSQVRFRLGRGGLPPYVHAAVEGMHVQERRTRSVPPDEAYGPYYPELAADIPAENTPPGMKVGDKVKLTNGLTARVTRHDPAQGLFSLDGNHPFAGRTLSLSLLLHDLMPADSPCFATVHLAAGCFWGLELAFQRLPGVVATAAGYTQGGNEGEGEERRAPTYSEVCSGRTGYVEAVEVLFDEGVVSFEKILEVFWNRHDPTQLNGQGNDLGWKHRDFTTKLL